MLTAVNVDKTTLVNWVCKNRLSKKIHNSREKLGNHVSKFPGNLPVDRVVVLR